MGVAQDFMSSMMATSLPQMLSGPTHSAGHTLDLASYTEVDVGDLGVKSHCLGQTFIMWGLDSLELSVSSGVD